jgi:hypothetical protein
MKRIISTLLFVVIVSSTVSQGSAQSATSAADPHLTAEERAKVVKLLRDTQKEYLEALENLTDAQWNYTPSPLKWSVGLTAEHIMLTELALFSAVEAALAEKANPDWQSKTTGKAEFIERVMPSRTRRAQAPREVRPTGKLSRDEVISRFKQMRAKVLEFAEKTDKPLKAHTLDHPFPVFGTLSAYDWLLYIPLHNLRHNKQIAEVKSSPNYPK